MVVGILGGGQLARMLALAGLPLGLRFRCLDPAPDAVAGHVGELVVGAYDDPEALRLLVRGVRLVTFEFENVPAAAADWLQAHARIAPSPTALAIGQDRLREKQLFRSLGMAVPEFRTADSREQLHTAVGEVGLPCVVKTRRLGYDGRGQVRLRAQERPAATIDAAWEALAGPGTGGLIVEQFVDFDRELSVIAARGRDGSIAVYPLVENEHAGGILRRSRAPAPDVPARVVRDADAFVRAALEHLDYTGVLTIELFLRGDTLLANEMAPRVHNSGHWTIEGSVCSQFENHLRAILGLPLGSTAMAGDGVATMVNLIGELPARARLLALAGLHVHAYGKSPRAGRKLGHATVVGHDRAAVDAIAAEVARLPLAAPGDWGFAG
ncbi:MAG: 5-(carboxyamino)imidazole ribonucleotide synthase [Planctomycetes bacterium]|nr:5-(carboxyamino)imidazole ribonucleotide synthase [Planctomycetota bacterium]